MKSLKNFRSNKSYRKRVYRIKSCRRLKERNHLERHRPIPNNSRRVKHHSPLYIILRSIFRVKIPSSQDYHSQHDEGKTRKGRNIPRDIRHPLPSPSKREKDEPVILGEFDPVVNNKTPRPGGEENPSIESCARKSREAPSRNRPITTANYHQYDDEGVPGRWPRWCRNVA